MKYTAIKNQLKKKKKEREKREREKKERETKKRGGWYIYIYIIYIYHIKLPNYIRYSKWKPKFFIYKTLYNWVKKQKGDLHPLLND